MYVHITTRKNLAGIQRETTTTYIHVTSSDEYQHGHNTSYKGYDNQVIDQ